ncbi:interleukin 1 beta S homeolog [Xenopus laevis]|uniref:Interleukin-1 n=1 Tax=Xenopus laevis TaxID=8355 RepID=Q9PVZ5_XENLA|nr:interleukin 1 beta S homeolog [Xenopus laevis]CAB53499.1 interleukin-1-beta [Xenopus laevis]
MALVPDLSSIPMEGYSGDDEMFYSDSPSGMKDDMGDAAQWQSSTSHCSLDIHVQITHGKGSLHSFRKAVVLVVAVEKLKRGKERFFGDEDLLGLLDSIFVEEEIGFSQAKETYASASTYRYQRATTCRIKDTSNKCFVMQKFHENAQLVALQLQGANIQREEKVSMAFYATQPHQGGSKRPVALGLAGKNLYLSCRATEDGQDSPKLYLEEISNIKDVKGEDLNRFIFMKSQDGLNETSTNSFESVAFPGWYISTSQRENELVQMVHQKNQEAIKDFNLFSVI